jgi:hypothetical protein
MADLDQIIQVQTWIDSALLQWERRTTEQEVAIGLAARSVLDAAWTSESRNSQLAIAGIRTVCKTFSSDSEASAKLLRRAFDPNHLKQFGHEELRWMVQAIPDLTVQDPAFVAELYIATFGWKEPAEDPTFMTKSRIFGMRSDKRQDYQMARWELGQRYPKYLEQAPTLATDVMLSAIETYCREEHRAESVTQQFQVDGINAEIRTDYSSIWDSWGGHSNDEPVSILQTYFRFLDQRASDPSSQGLVAALLDRLIQKARDAVIWRHLIELAMKHPWIADKLRGLSWAQPVLSGHDMERPMYEFLRMIYPTLSTDEKVLVEDAVMQLPEQAKNKEIGQMISDEFLGALSDFELQTPRAKRQQNLLREKNALQKEAPEQFQIHGGAMAPDPERDYRYRGIDTRQPANQKLISLQKPIREFCGRNMSGSLTLDECVRFLPEMEALLCALGDSSSTTPDENILRESFALLIWAASKIANVGDLGANAELTRFAESVLQIGAAAVWPEATPDRNKEFDKHGSWGVPTGRVEAAEGLMALATKQNCDFPPIFRTLGRLMQDPSAIVRSQIAGATLGLYERAPEKMWEMLSTFADDPSVRVRLAAVGCLDQLARAHPTRALLLVKHIFDGIDINEEGTSELTRSCVLCLTRYYVWRADGTGEEVVVHLATELPQRRKEAGMMLFALRHGMMAAEKGELSAEEALSVRLRSVRIFNLLVTNATALLRPLIAAIARKEELSEADAKTFVELIELVRIVGRELYFALGAFQEHRFSLAPEITSSEQPWLYHAVGPSWDLLAEIGETQLAHNLAQSLEMFISIDPEKIFLRIGTIIRASEAWGYHYEQMAIDLILRIFTTYLAEYRSLLQQNAECLKIMRKALELFINTGWPSARRLSYRVDEIFR